MRLDFTGRVALITGAGGGLGRAYAHWLARRGARIVVNNRTHPDRPSSAQAVADEIVAAGGEAVADHHSVEAPGSGAAMVARALESFGALDIVIANAATSGGGAIDCLRLEDYRRLMDANFYGAIDPILAALPHMRAHDYGRLIVTTSATALFGGLQHTAYAASKMALIGFARSLSVELRPTNIKVNTISPYARTNMSKDVIGEHLATLMAPEQVAPVVGWLASEACDRSGIILSAGAGRVRRAALVETPVAELDGEDGLRWSILDDVVHATETSSGRKSSAALIPELLAR